MYRFGATIMEAEIIDDYSTESEGSYTEEINDEKIVF
jgi:hypothetical protein